MSGKVRIHIITKKFNVQLSFSARLCLYFRTFICSTEASASSGSKNGTEGDGLVSPTNGELMEETKEALP